MLKYLLTFALVLVFLCSTQHVFTQITQAKFNQSNSIEIVARLPEGDGVRMSVTYHGTTQIVDIISEEHDINFGNRTIKYNWHRNFFDPQIKFLQYTNIDTVVIYSRLGHRLNGVSFLNLKNMHFADGFACHRFSISPDMKHFAYSYPFNGDKNFAVFVDDAMVFPVHILNIQPGFSPGESQGVDFTEKIGKRNPERLLSPFAWPTSGTLAFIYETRVTTPSTPAKEEKKFKKINIEGVSRQANQKITEQDVSEGQVWNQDWSIP